MACGLCVVSTDVGGIPYLLKDECDALLVPPNDETRMADAVRRVLLDCRLAERLSRSGRSKAEQHDWSQVVPHWNRTVSKVLSGGSWAD
jgi:glycosyltransferase involved in cell wall biosynthesis